MKYIFSLFFLLFALSPLSAQETIPDDAVVTRDIITNVFDAELVRVKDGDTFIALVLMPTEREYYDYEEIEVTCRLFRCDTYEMGDEDSENAAKAQAAKYFTTAKLTRRFKIEFHGKDYYDRLLVTVYLDNTTLSEMLRDKNYLTGKYEDAKENRRVRRY